MKKPTKSIITSSLLAVAFGALSVGTTFALFTSQSETQINVESAIVDVRSTLSNPTLYSASATYTTGDVAGTLTGTFAGTYYYEPQPGLTFANGGSVTLQNSILGIQKMTPGDKVSGSLSFVNNSNVNIKYRFVVNTSSESDDILLSNMVFKVLGNTYTGLKSLRTNWMPLAAFGSIDSTTLEVILPLEAGNENQNKSASYAFSVEAVQGNAITSEEEYVSYVTSTYVPLNVNDVGSQSKLTNEKVIQTALPNAQTASEIVSVTVPQNAKLDSNASALTLYVENLGEDPTYQGIVIDVEQGAEIYDVKLEGIDENNTEPVTVTVNLGYEPIAVYHKHGDTATQIPFTYDSTTGLTTFTTTNFSDFTFVRETDIIEVPNAAKLAIVRNHVNSGHSLAGKTVKLVDDIDLNNQEWTPIGTSATPFGGVFDGQEHIVFNLSITSGGYKGLFGYVSGATVKNVTLNNAHISGTERTATLIACIKGSTTVLYCSNDAKSTVSGSGSNTGGLIAEIACDADVTISHCINNASVTNTASSNSRAGGVVGQATLNKTHLFVFDNCINYGAVKSNMYVGGIVCSLNDGDMVANFIECSNDFAKLDGTYKGNMIGWSQNYHNRSLPIQIINCSGSIENIVGYFNAAGRQYYKVDDNYYMFNISAPCTGEAIFSQTSINLSKSYHQTMDNYWHWATDNLGPSFAGSVDLTDYDWFFLGFSMTDGYFNYGSEWYISHNPVNDNGGYNENHADQLSVEDFKVTWETDLLYVLVD